MKTYKHEESGAELCREIAQPHATAFADCFERWAPWDFNHNQTSRQAFGPRMIYGQSIAENLFQDCKHIMEGKKVKRKHPDYPMEVGPFLHFRDYNRPSLCVTCKDWVLSRIAERTIIIPRDRMSFEVVDHDNGWSLVVASHCQIIGSVWLAYIKTASIPVAKNETVCV